MAADTGLQLPGTVLDVAGTGDRSWSNDDNAKTESDSEYAECLHDKADYSNDFRLYNFGLTIPAGREIKGVKIQLRMRGEGALDPRLNECYLIENGSILSGCEDKGTDQLLGSNWYTRTLGGETDLWNCSLTSAICNSSTFGIQMKTYCGANQNNWHARLAWAKIQVFYEDIETAEVQDGAGKSEVIEVVVTGSFQDGLEQDGSAFAPESADVEEEASFSDSIVVHVGTVISDGIVRADAAAVTPEDEGDDGSGLLLAVASDSEYRNYSTKDQNLSYLWHGVITGIDSIKMTLSTKHGGFIQVSAGQVRFTPDAFGGLNHWSFSDWPPPKTLTAIFRCKIPGQQYSTKLFEGILYRARIGEETVVYDVYISSYTETIPSGTSLASWPSTNTLVGFFSKVCDVLGLTLDSSKAAVSPPALSHTLQNERLVIDVADEVAAFCCHCFWIENGTLYLQAMANANGTLSLQNTNDYLRTPRYIDEVPVNRVVAESGEYVGSEYPFGNDYELSVNYTGDDSQLQAIYNLVNALWIDIPMPVSVGCGEFVPGKEVTVLDNRLAVESEAVLKMRAVVYDFMSRKITIGGDGSLDQV